MLQNIIFGICFISNNVLVTRAADQTLVKYEVPPDKEFSIQCAVEALSNIYTGVIVDDKTGACTVTTTSTQVTSLPGSFYMSKKTTVMTYETDGYENRTIERTFWKLPGKFGVGARLKVIVTLPSESTWERFRMSVVQHPWDFGESIYFILNPPYVKFQCSDSNLNQKFMTVQNSYFQPSKSYTIELQAGLTHVMYYIDGEFAMEIEHCIPPEKINSFEYKYYTNQSEPVIPEIKKLIFVGL